MENSEKKGVTNAASFSSFLFEGNLWLQNRMDSLNMILALGKKGSSCAQFSRYKSVPEGLFASYLLGIFKPFIL